MGFKKLGDIYPPGVLKGRATYLVWGVLKGVYPLSVSK